jgi:hypothetical protein
MNRFLKGHFVRLCSIDRQRQNNYFAYLKLDRFRRRRAKAAVGDDSDLLVFASSRLLLNYCDECMHSETHSYMTMEGLL